MDVDRKGIWVDRYFLKKKMMKNVGCCVKIIWEIVLKVMLVDVKDLVLLWTRYDGIRKNVLLWDFTRRLWV
jgi:hypothetical protein